MQDFELKDKMRIVHPILYQKLGLDPRLDYSHSAIGVLTVSPAETAVITADISMKTANVELGFVDRFSGTLILTGRVAEVESAFQHIADYFRDKLHFTVCELTRT